MNDSTPITDLGFHLMVFTVRAGKERIQEITKEKLALEQIREGVRNLSDPDTYLVLARFYHPCEDHPKGHTLFDLGTNLTFREALIYVRACLAWIENGQVQSEVSFLSHIPEHGDKWEAAFGHIGEKNNARTFH